MITSSHSEKKTISDLRVFELWRLTHGFLFLCDICVNAGRVYIILTQHVAGDAVSGPFRAGID